MDAERQQPNFVEASNALIQFADHIGRCENLPAVQGGNQLMQALHEIRTEVREMRQEVRNGFIHLHTRIDGVERTARAMDSNHSSRLENSTALRDDAQIAPLFNCATGEVIEPFPQDVSEMARLDSAGTNRILEALGASTHGSLARRRQRLFRLAGVYLRAV